MSKKLIGLTLALALFAVALPASAAGLTQSQIAAIVALLQSFGAEQSVINNVSVSLGGGTPSNTGNTVSCVELSYNLFSGSTDNTTGGQVTKLQRFLGVQMTGYFGPETEAAVQKWQASHGVVSSGSPDSTGYGYVGAKTRAAMARGCNGSTTSDVIFAATPTYGTAPLFVKFSTNQKSGVIYYDKGAFMGSCLPDEAERGSCDFSIGNGWTYKNPGTYTATLTTACPTNEPNCSTRVLGTKTITVTSQTANTPSATVNTPVVTPISGSDRFDVAFKGSAVNFGGTHAGDQRYNWAWVSVVPSSYDGSLDLHAFKGKGESGPIVGSSGAEVHNNEWSHSFNLAAGTYKVLVYDYYGVSSMPITTRTITITGKTSNQTPSMKILSPNGGESYRLDQPLTIKWSAENIPTGASFVVEFRRQGGGEVTRLATANSTDRSMTFPSIGEIRGGGDLGTMDVGAYTVNMWVWAGAELAARDSSDGMINILQPAGSNPAATIDNSSLSQNTGNFRVNGSASNATSLQVIMVTGNYTGATDWNSANAAVRANSVYNVNSTARVENGRWVGVFGSGSGGAGVPAGTYTLLVYDLSQYNATPSVAPKLLTRNMLTVQY